MRLQSITQNFLTSIILSSFVYAVYAVYVPNPTGHLSSTKYVAAQAAVRGGGNSAMDQTMIDNNSGPTISKRENYRVPYHGRGAFCDKTFYHKDFIKSTALDACSKLLKKSPSKTRQKIMSCAPNVPYCNYNFPHLYKGPPEFFNHRRPLYVWPIGNSRFRKLIGSKGNDRIVFDLNDNCRVHGLVHKNFWGKWSPCKINW